MSGTFFELRVESLILLALLFAFTLDGVNADLFVILLKGSQILSGHGELSLLHALSHVPVDEGALGVHEIKLVVKTSPGLGDGGRVGQHADGALNLGQVTSGHHCGGLVVDAHLEAGGAPVHELDGPLGLDGGDGGVDVLGDNITTVQHAAGHVLAVAGVALHHLVGWLEASVGHFSHGQLLVVSLLSRDDRRVCGQGEVDPGVGHQVGLELCEIHVEGAVEPERGGDGGHDLADQPVQVGVRGTLDVQVSPADVVDGFVVYHEGAVRVLQCGVGGQDGVVRLYYGGRYLGGGVNGELELGFLAVVDGETFHEQGGEARAGAAAERVEDEEALQAGALVSQLADPVENKVDDLLADGVVPSGVVVGGVFLAGDQLLGVEQLAVGAGADLVNDGGLKIHEDGSWDVFAGAGLAEEGVEGIVSSADGFV